MRRLKPLIALLVLAALLYWLIPAFMDSTAGNVPITYYGRLIDTQYNPIPNFKISARVARMPFVQLWDARETFGDPVTLTTDANGYFKFTGARGTCLDLRFETRDWHLVDFDGPLPRRYDRWARTPPPDVPERTAWFKMKRPWERLYEAPQARRAAR